MVRKVHCLCDSPCVQGLDTIGCENVQYEPIISIHQQVMWLP